MKFKEIIEQVTSGAVAQTTIPHGFGVVRRVMVKDTSLLPFDKMDKKKKKKKKVQENVETEGILAGTGVPEKSPHYKKSKKKFKKKSLIKKYDEKLKEVKY